MGFWRGAQGNPKEALTATESNVPTSTWRSTNGVKAFAMAFMAV